MAVKDKYGGYLRPKYRVSDLRPDKKQSGTVIGMSPPFSVTVAWDGGEEEVVRGDNLAHESKTFRRL